MTARPGSASRRLEPGAWRSAGPSSGRSPRCAFGTRSRVRNVLRRPTSCLLTFPATRQSARGRQLWEREMTLGRIGGVLLVAGGAAILLAFGLGSAALAVGAIALVGLGAATLAMAGPWPLGGRLARAGLGLSAIGLAGFTVSGLAIDDLHPSSPLVGLALIVAVLVSVLATGVGGLLIGASAVRTIWGVRRTSEISPGELDLAPSGPENTGQGSGRRVRRIRRGVVALLAAMTLVGLTGYTAYVGAIGSDQLLHPSGNPDCRTPLVRYGWTYEAVNYDIADDAVLQGQNPDMEHCASQGAIAGSEVVTADGVRIAGWYVPAADGAGPTGTTVVLSLIHISEPTRLGMISYAVF